MHARLAFDHGGAVAAQLGPKPFREGALPGHHEGDVIVPYKVFRVFDDAKMRMRRARPDLMQESLHRVAVEGIAE